MSSPADLGGKNIQQHELRASLRGTNEGLMWQKRMWGGGGFERKRDWKTRLGQIQRA